MGDGGDEVLSLVASRADFLEALRERPLEKREMVDVLEYSRATVNRVVNELESSGLVTRTGEGYEPTLVAVLAVEEYRDFLVRERDILRAQPVVDHLDHRANVPREFLRGAQISSGRETNENLHDLADWLEGKDDVGVVLPPTRPLAVLEACRNVLVETDGAVRLIVPVEAYRGLTGAGQLLPEMAGGGCHVTAAETPPYGLVTASAAGEWSARLLIYDSDEGAFGAVQNERGRAVDWAREIVEELRADGTDVTNELELAHGAEVPERASRDVWHPLALENEGFVRLTEEYFKAHEPRDFSVALRTGLTLSEVEAGYAVERTLEGEASDEAQSLTQHLVKRLSGGQDCAIVGQPGSGKSTVAKAVACAWFDRDIGTVLYRESGTGDSFGSVALLRNYLRTTHEETLVVVEDAVRESANDVFRLAEEFRADDSVHFLFDARSSEWMDTRSLPVDAAVREYKNAVPEVIELGDPEFGDCERFLGRFHSLSGVETNLSPQDLLDGVWDDEANSGGMFLLAHRVSLYADPVGVASSTTPTRLVEDVQRRLAELADEGTLTKEAALFVHLLNAAGERVTADFVDVHAGGPGGEATDRPLARLHDLGVVWTSDQQGRLRIGHELWSRRMLTEALEVFDDAPGLLGRAVDRVLALAEEQSGARTEAGGRGRLARRIAPDPETWADEFTRRLFRYGCDVPALAPYFGRFDEQPFSLEARCSTVGALHCHRDRAKMLAGSGQLEAALEEYRSVEREIPEGEGSDEVREVRARCVGGAATVLMRLGRLDEAEAAFERALEAHREIGDRTGEADALQGLGMVYFRRTEYGRDLEYQRAALELFEEFGELRRQSNALGNMASVYVSMEAYDEATEHAERSLELRERIGFDLGVAQCHNVLGRVAEAKNDLDRAREHHRETLARAVELGNPEWQVIGYINLGNVATGLGNLVTAEEYLERGIRTVESMGDVRDEAILRRNLAEVWRQQGKYDTAAQEAGEALECAEEVSDDRVRGLSKGVLGRVALAEGRYGEAESTLTEALEAFDELELREPSISVLLAIAQVAIEEGRPDEAKPHLDRAESALEEADSSDQSYEAKLSCLRACVEYASGDFNRARAQRKDALQRSRELANMYVVAWLHTHLGLAESGYGQDRDAEQTLKRGRRLAAEVGATGLEQRSQSRLATET
ncbi:tetratricopeptide repeat protein (plasmid) [Salinirubellus salinus]|uniref:Tetratricopeptide repeat protein n=1 Tax=Salinirubellus salinus TaxID=1364945 RepID=A0A9E7R8C3_9EURY|nr:tetratricopeptide repeat protein [Salinirubellus salinus]UWM56949.1 tetratricopeptide repeat protein [Salinirubellus salinus]